MTTKEVLEQSLLKIRQGWTKYGLATNWAGLGTYARSPEAASWCGFGAVHAVVGDYGAAMSPALELLYQALPEHKRRGAPADALTRYNDRPDTTQEDMIKLFERAIDLA